ncbi:MAG: mandelate racemase/muconate lactonizing enzyme family protein, partial [Actinomycetia bacterium]|nr:mandelate racemase/muconate lactonizing enzyme family protein [Actinomycetes bacterium]
MSRAEITTVDTEILVAGRMVHLLVHIGTDEGLAGTGEGWWGVAAKPSQPPDAAVAATAMVVDTILGPQMIGRDARAIGAIWHDLAHDSYRWGDGGMVMCALSGIDLALWDLAGKRHEVPVMELLGGPALDSVPAYASLPPLRTEEALGTEIARARDAGFGAIKLHEIEADTLRFAFEQAGDLGVMVDVNGHYDPIEARSIGRMLEDLGAVWFEEPVSPMRDMATIAGLRAELSVPIAAGENEWSLLDADRMLRSGAIDYFQPEITKIGGLTPGLRQSALAELHNVAFCPHNFRNGPSLNASIHWAFTSPNAKWLELPWLPEGFDFPLGWPLPTLTDGRVTPPTGPGLSSP